MGYGPWRGGRVWVLDDKCETCIFRPGNLMELHPGRVREMVATCVQEQRVISCHDTLDGPRSICRGFWDGYRERIVVLRLAVAKDLVSFDRADLDDVA